MTWQQTHESIDEVVRMSLGDSASPRRRAWYFLRGSNPKSTARNCRHYYEQTYSGLGRNDLATNKAHDGNAFYRAVLRLSKEFGFSLDDALPEKRYNDWSFLRGIDPESTTKNCRLYYQQKYQGMGRNDLAKNKVYNGNPFYRAVLRLSKEYDFSLDQVFPPSKSKRKKK
jgi:hypothetical protein